MLEMMQVVADPIPAFVAATPADRREQATRTI